MSKTSKFRVLHPQLFMAVAGVLQHVVKDTVVELTHEAAKRLGSKITEVGTEVVTAVGNADEVQVLKKQLEEAAAAAAEAEALKKQLEEAKKALEALQAQAQAQAQAPAPATEPAAGTTTTAKAK